MEVERGTTRKSCFLGIYSTIVYATPLSLLVLLFCVVWRTLATFDTERFDQPFHIPVFELFACIDDPPSTSLSIYHYEEVTSEGTCTENNRLKTITTFPSHICCLHIWIVMAYLSVVFVCQMFDISPQNRRLGWIGTCCIVLVGLCAIMYEAWMFSFIHDVYAIEFVAGVRLIILLPFFTLILHTIYQFYFLVYSKANFYPLTTGSKVHICTSIVFNSIMVLHIILMGLTTFCKGVPERVVTVKGEGYLVVALLGIVELVYRLWIIREYVHLLAKFCRPPAPTPAPVQPIQQEQPDLDDKMIVAAENIPINIRQDKDEEKKEEYMISSAQEESFLEYKSDCVCGTDIFTVIWQYVFTAIITLSVYLLFVNWMFLKFVARQPLNITSLEKI